MEDLLTDADYNGECFVTGVEGERETDDLYKKVVVPRGFAYSGQNFTAGDRIWFNRFLVANYEQQVANGVVPQVARKIAYVRFLAAREGLFDFAGTPEAHHVRYSNIVAGEPIAQTIDDWESDEEWRENIVAKLHDMVGCVAYIFRVRGHHWTEEIDERYRQLWRKCLYDEDSPNMEWKHIAINALHAVYPDDLDKHWQIWCENSTVAGALIKRFSSYPAGIAGIAALQAGAQDLELAMPKILERVSGSVEHLNAVIAEVRANRWAGSVNRRFYNAPIVRQNEGALAALAAAIVGGLRALAPQAPLLQSKALLRIAGNAPLTGGILATTMAAAARHERAALSLLPDVEE